MNITYIPSKPPSDGPSLTPEGLAATLARYSRSNKGIQTLLEESKTKSPQEIFRFVDYGHASIGGLTGGLAIALDGISMVAALKLFEFSQMADGQESSTRYITLSADQLPSPESLGIPDQTCQLWRSTCQHGVELYEIAYREIQKSVTENPNKVRLPEKAKTNEKIRQRILKNYALDRSRNLLPASLKTNMALVMTARCWAETIKLINSLDLPETNRIAELLREELHKASPNLTRHSHPDTASRHACQDALQPWVQNPAMMTQTLQQDAPCECRVALHEPPPPFFPLNPSIKNAFEGKIHRYSSVGHWVKRQTTHTAWSAMAVAEVRDLNRHRNGHRFSPLFPIGFELCPETRTLLQRKNSPLLKTFLTQQNQLLQELINTKKPGLYMYGLSLGSQVAYEHTQPLDKFLYEAELRTGLGAHYRYAELLKQATEKLLELHPPLKPYIQLGEAEPE